MPIKKNQLSALISDLVGGGDPPQNTKFHTENIYLLAELARNELIATDYNQRRNLGEYDINGDFITTFTNVPVLEDTERAEHYSNLPARFASLPNNRGLRLVSEMQNQKKEFVQLATGSLNTYANLEAGGLVGRTGYYIEGEKIFYDKLDHAHVTKVLIKMVVAIDDLDPEELIPIPSSMEALLLERIVQLLQEQKVTPQDKLNDTNTR